ncbi:MAG: hypothetical protein AB7O38_09305 [Pirellulaceae bacterium]
MSSVVNCPHCGQQVLVTQDPMISKRVVCPHCQRTFQLRLTAWAASAAPPPPPPPVSPVTLPSGPSAASQSVTAACQRVQVPAYGLMVTGGLTFFTAFLFLPSLLFPQALELPPQSDLEVVFGVVFMLLTFALGIAVLYGALQLQQLASYRWSLAAAVLACLPCYCFFVGVPFGIWALVLLSRLDVQRAFAEKARPPQ